MLCLAVHTLRGDRIPVRIINSLSAMQTSTQIVKRRLSILGRVGGSPGLAHCSRMWTYPSAAPWGDTLLAPALSRRGGESVSLRALATPAGRTGSRRLPVELCVQRLTQLRNGGVWLHIGQRRAQRSSENWLQEVQKRALGMINNWAIPNREGKGWHKKVIGQTK